MAQRRTGGAHKLAGILLEAEAVADDRLAVVVRIGTNVVAAPEGHADAGDLAQGARHRYLAAEELFRELSDSWTEFRRALGWRTRLWRDPKVVAGARAGLGQPVAIHAGGAPSRGLRHHR